MQLNKLFIAIFGTLTGGFLLFYFLVAFQLQEFSGSQTRLGGYRESEFGWNLPQRAFPERERMHDATTMKDYDRPYDLVIIGDSFSHNSEMGWQNYLIDVFGLSALFIHVDRVAVDELLEQESWRRYPPALVVWSSQESAAVERLRRISRTMPADGSASLAGERPLIDEWSQKRQIDLRAHVREKDASFLRQLALAGDYLYKIVIRHLLWNEITGVEVVDSGCPACFSDAETGRYLSFAGDRAARFGDKQLVKAAGVLRRIREVVEANGKTRFISLIFPNKIGVYGDIGGGSAGRRLSGTALVTPATAGIDLLPEFDAAIRRGAVDLYLPNDHHTGWLGYRLTARLIACALSLPGEWHCGEPDR